MGSPLKRELLWRRSRPEIPSFQGGEDVNQDASVTKGEPILHRYLDLLNFL